MMISDAWSNVNVKIAVPTGCDCSLFVTVDLFTFWLTLYTSSTVLSNVFAFLHSLLS